MKIRAKIYLENSKTLKFITFSDLDSNFELSLNRYEGENTIEVLMCYQSCYRPNQFEFTLSNDKAMLKFPKGTIDPVDGVDFYEIEFDKNKYKFNEIVSLVKQIFNGLNGQKYNIT